MLKHVGFWGLVLILITSVFGITAKNSRYVKQYIIDDYEYGIYLSNDNQLFYNISPFDFSFYSLEESKKLVQWEKYIEKNENEILEKARMLMPTILSSINRYNPQKTIKTEIGEFLLKTQTLDNKVTISTEIPMKSGKIIKTITYNESDIVFDNDLEIYSVNDPEILSYFAEYTKYSFKDEKEDAKVYKNRIYIVNLNNPGIIEIKIPSNGASVDSKYRVINLNTFNNEDIEITLHNKLEDIK